MQKLILFGDSITAGYTEGEITLKLNDAIGSRTLAYTIRNAGIPGDTTRDGLLRVVEHVVAYQPDKVTVFFGANDVSIFSDVSLELFKTNLKDLVTKIGTNRVILIGTPYACQTLYASERPLACLKAYDEVARKIAEAYQISFIPLLEEMQKNSNPNHYLQADGLHFSDEGYELLGQLIVEKLRK